jgi:hypothetical protein
MVEAGADVHQVTGTPFADPLQFLQNIHQGAFMDSLSAYLRARPAACAVETEVCQHLFQALVFFRKLLEPTDLAGPAPRRVSSTEGIIFFWWKKKIMICETGQEENHTHCKGNS